MNQSMKFCFVFSVFCLLSLAPRVSGEGSIATGFYDTRMDKDLEILSEVYNNLGVDPAIVSWQTDFSKPFPRQQCAKVCESGRIPLIQWNATFSVPNSKFPSNLKLRDIIDGKMDAYLTSWASDAAAVQKPILVKLFNDFNISAYPWSIEANQKNSAYVRRAFQKIVAVFRAAQADNVKWVWGPSCFPGSFAAWNDYEDAYPGNGFVDFIGLSGIDCAGSNPQFLPLTFEQIFSQPVRRIKTFAEEKPFIITQVSTLAEGPYRQRWIRSMSSTITTSMSDLKGLVWYLPRGLTGYSTLDKEAFLTLRKSENEDSSKDAFFDKPFWSLKFLPFHREGRFKPQVLKVPFVNETNPKKLAEALEVSPWLHLDSSFIPVIGHELAKADNFSAKIRLGWNMSGLLFWCEVIDSSLGEGKLHADEIWDGDNLELGIGLPQFSDLKVSMKDVFRLLISPGGPSQLNPSVVLYRGEDGNSENDISEIKVFSQFGTGEDRYRLFGVIGWRSMGIAPSMGNIVPFTIAVTDGVKGHRARQLIWAGSPHYYHDASEWGELLLSTP